MDHLHARMTLNKPLLKKYCWFLTMQTIVSTASLTQINVLGIVWDYWPYTP